MSRYTIFTWRKCINEKFSIKIDNTSISETNSINFLGVYIDNSLNKKKHISCIADKISGEIGLIWKVENTLTRKFYWLHIFVSYIPSWYIVIAHGKILIKQSHPNCRYYKTEFCVSLLVLSIDDISTPRLKSQGILDMYEINVYITGMFMYKIYNDNVLHVFDDSYI